MIIEYEINVATFNRHWHRLVLDTTSREVFWDPIIKTSPKLNQTLETKRLKFFL